MFRHRRSVTHAMERLGLACQLGLTGILEGGMQVAPTVSVVPSQTLVSCCWAVLSARFRCLVMKSELSCF